MAEANIDNFDFTSPQGMTGDLMNSERRRMLTIAFDLVDKIWDDAWPLIGSKARVLVGDMLLADNSGKEIEERIRKALIAALEVYPIISQRSLQPTR